MINIQTMMNKITYHMSEIIIICSTMDVIDSIKYKNHIDIIVNMVFIFYYNGLYLKKRKVNLYFINLSLTLYIDIIRQDMIEC